MFIGTYAGPLSPDPAEIEELRWVALNELKRDMLTHPERYTAWFFTALGIAERGMEAARRT